MTVVYVDMLLGLNLVIDYVLVCGCARVLQLPSDRRRMIGAAAVGALSSLLILLPPMPTALSLLCKLGTALLMVPIAFPCPTFGRFCKAVITLFVLSALFAGVCNGLYLLFDPSAVTVQSGIVYMPVEPLLLLVLITASYGVLCLYDRITRQRLAKHAAYRLEIRHNGEQITLYALYDSGHHLRDSFSGAPVIIVERAALGALQIQAQPALAGAGSHPIRYIPFSSLGGSGMLPSFRPQEVLMHSDGETTLIDPVWIAVCERLGKGDYRALIGPDIANRS